MFTSGHGSRLSRVKCVLQASDYKSVLLMLQDAVIGRRGTDVHLPTYGNIPGRRSKEGCRGRRQQSGVRTYWKEGRDPGRREEGRGRVHVGSGGW